MGTLLFGDTDACIYHPNSDLIVEVRFVFIGIKAYPYTTLFGEFYGIGEEVLDDLPNLVGIGVDGCRCIR